MHVVTRKVHLEFNEPGNTLVPPDNADASSRLGGRMCGSSKNDNDVDTTVSEPWKDGSRGVRNRGDTFELGRRRNNAVQCLRPNCSVPSRKGSR